MLETRRQTRSAGTQRQAQQSDVQFWNNQPDPVLIKRGQSQAIQLVRSTVKPTATTGEVVEPNTTDTSAVPPMVYIDDEGLEEQFLMGDEASQEVMDITANRVTAPVSENEVSPLDPIYTQRSQQDDLDLHPSRGPREESMVNMLHQFLDDKFEDILRTSNKFQYLH